MKLRIPLFVKIMTPLVVLILLSLAVSGYLIFRESTRRLQEDLAERLVQGASFVANNVDIASLQSIQQPTDYRKPEYGELLSVLEQAQAAGGLDWIGIYRRAGDSLYYWVDVEENSIGYPFFFATPEHQAAFDDPQGEPRAVYYTDEWGAWEGYVAPVVATGGDGAQRVIGIVEAVVSGERNTLLQQRTVQTVRAIMIGGGLAAIALSLLATIITFNRPMRRLKQGALALAGGSYGVTIDLDSNDELGELAGVFNTMSGELKQNYDAIQQRNIELQMVYQIAQTITASSDDPGSVLNTILDRVQQMIPFDEGEICLYVPEENALRVRGWKGLKDSIDWRERRYPLGQGFTGNVGQSRRSFLSDDITQHDSLRPVYANVVENPVRSYLGVPLLVGDRLVGTMQIVSTQAAKFDRHTQQLLETIALQAAVAIETAQKVEARERVLKEQIAQLRIEIDEARRANQVAEVTDTDYFKNLQQQARQLRTQRASKGSEESKT